MSSDLWNEFVDRAGGLSENPWAQTPSISDTTSQSTHESDIKPTLITPIFDHAEKRKSQFDHDPQWANSGHESYAKTSPTLEMTSDLEAINIWTTVPSQRQETSSRLVTACEDELEPVLTLSKEATATSEEFESFVGPEDSFYQPERNEKLNHYGDSTNNKPLSDEILSSRGTNYPQAPGTQSRYESNPYSGLETLDSSTGCKVQTRFVQGISVQAKELPNRRVEAISKNDSTSEVPYRVDEWGEFSPNPQDSVGFGEDQVVSTKLSQDDISESGLRYRSPPFPDAKDESFSKPPQAQVKPLSFKRPFNVPPPSVLVSHFTSLIQALPNQVEGIVHRSSNKEISQKAFETTLYSYIASLRVAARIIAGRKLRWRRDNVLSSSMTIGLAQAGGKSGMKLAGIDKTESRREDGELVECVRVWKQYLGKIRATLVAATSQISGRPLVLPEISERMTIVTTKLTGPKTPLSGCALCGIVREERVAKVDLDVWDNLGEWWSDGWGHTECRIFWEEHEKLIQPP